MTVNITEKDIMKIKSEALEFRDKVISAKSTYENVVKNIDNYQEELKQLGVEGNVDETIEQMAKEVNDIYSESLEIIKGWKLKLQ